MMNGVKNRVLFAGAIIALFASGARADDVKAVGSYYNVPVTQLSNNYGEQKESVSTGTAQILVYNRDDGTTAIQLNVVPESQNGVITIFRQDVPESAKVAFGALDELSLRYQNMYSHTDRFLIAELLDENGKPPGQTIAFFDPTGKPANNAIVEYTIPPNRMGTADGGSTGIIALEEQSRILFPRPQFDDQFRNMGNYQNLQFTAIDPLTGTRMSLAYENNLYTPDGVTSLTVPFLNNWNTTSPDIEIYSGKILNFDSSSAGQKKIRINNFRTGNYYGFNNEDSIGPDGRFRFSRRFITSPSDGSYFQQAPVSIDIGDNQGHTLTTATENIIQSERVQTFDVKFLDENGDSVNLTSVPILSSDSPWIGTVMQKTTPQPNSRGLHSFYSATIMRSDDKTSIQPVKLKVPAEYTAEIFGYLYESGKVEPTDKFVTFKRIVKEFQINGRVENADGKPFVDAYVFVTGVASAYPQSIPNKLPLSATLGKLWSESQGQFDKLGAYLARSDSEGNYEIKGKSLSELASVMVTAPGYGVVSQMVAETSGTGGLRGRMSGDIQLETATLVKEATATLSLQLFENVSTASKSIYNVPPVFSVGTNFLPTIPDNAPATRPIIQSKKQFYWAVQARGDTITTSTSPVDNSITKWKHIELSVPAETTFTLKTLSPRFNDIKTERFDYKDLTITDPFKPGETRDLGRVEGKLAADEKSNVPVDNK